MLAEAKADDAPVELVAGSRHEVVSNCAIDELAGRVMAKHEAIGGLTNRQAVIIGRRTNGEQELVLLRVDPVGAGRFFAEGEEAPDGDAEIVEAGVIDGRGGCGHLSTIVS